MSTLVGLDIGFSESGRTNALAELRDGTLSVRLLNVAERNIALEHTTASVIAIDAPLLPEDAPVGLRRGVESAFARGRFQKRCKPGASHVPGTGQQLRAHGSMAADHIRPATGPDHCTLIRPGKPVVEAFPNTFLGVLLDDACFEQQPKLKRGKKFDWLYGNVVRAGVFRSLIAAFGLPESVAIACEIEQHHERRAALVCLLTAAAVGCGRFTAVGHPECGYFFLPGRDLWAEWARATLESVRIRLPELRIEVGAASAGTTRP